MSFFRELKAKKAKYGFTIKVNELNLLEIGQFMKVAVGDIPQTRDTWFLDLKSNFNHNTCNIYINDDKIYNKFSLENDNWKE